LNFEDLNRRQSRARLRNPRLADSYYQGAAGCASRRDRSWHLQEIDCGFRNPFSTWACYSIFKDRTSNRLRFLLNRRAQPFVSFRCALFTTGSSSCHIFFSASCSTACAETSFPTTSASFRLASFTAGSSSCHIFFSASYSTACAENFIPRHFRFPPAFVSRRQGVARFYHPRVLCQQPDSEPSFLPEKVCGDINSTHRHDVLPSPLGTFRHGPMPCAGVLLNEVRPGGARTSPPPLLIQFSSWFRRPNGEVRCDGHRVPPLAPACKSFFPTEGSDPACPPSGLPAGRWGSYQLTASPVLAARW